MANMSVTVLCPGGRRVNVKVNPNTSVLQIIEEASLKQGFNPDDYELRHLRRVLDCSNNVRHAGLPNRCQLEMVEAAVPRSPISVNVHIVTESGLRLVHDFPCTTTLWEALVYHKENSVVEEDFLPPVDSGKEVVLVYAMRRITCPELTKVSLRTLGLTSGKCMLRHSIQSMSSSGCQAHVSSLLRRPVRHLEEEEVNSLPMMKNHVYEDSENPGFPDGHNICQPKEEELIPQDITMKELPELRASSSPPAMLKEATPDVPSQSSDECVAPLDLTTSPSARETPTPKVTKIGNNNAIVFSMADAPPTLTGDEDDAFFQLTAEEVRRLYKEQRKALTELQEAPLMTKNMREMEESSKVLTAMNRYPITHLRIHFPDEHVIQASFKPTDTVADIISFLRPFLARPTAEFSLSTRHPHRTLSPNFTMVAADCVPNARLYYETASAGPYLSEDTLAKKSSYSGACSSLNNMHKTKTMPLGIGEKGYSLCEPSSSRRKEDTLEQDARSHVSGRASGAVPKVPKWFKLGK